VLPITSQHLGLCRISITTLFVKFSKICLVCLVMSVNNEHEYRTASIQSSSYSLVINRIHSKQQVSQHDTLVVYNSYTYIKKTLYTMAAFPKQAFRSKIYYAGARVNNSQHIITGVSRPTISKTKDTLEEKYAHCAVAEQDKLRKIHIYSFRLKMTSSECEQ